MSGNDKAKTGPARQGHKPTGLHPSPVNNELENTLMPTESEFPATARQEWKAGLPLVTAATVGMSLGALLIYSPGVFFTSLEQEFGWTRAQITSGLAINAVVGVLLSPFMGRLIDLVGPRRIAIPGVILFGCAFAGLSLANASALIWWLLWLMLAFTVLLVKPTLWAAAVASRFDRNRGLALAIMLSGTGLTAFLAPIVGTRLIDHFGWRGAYVGLALLWCGMVLPLVAAYFYSAADLSRSGRGDARPKAAPTPAPVLARHLLTSRVFLMLALSVIIVVFTVAGVLVNFVPILIDSGMAPRNAASAAGIAGIAAIIGRVSTGFLLDRFNPSVISSISFALPLPVMIGLLAFNGSMTNAVIIACLLGLCVGAEMDIATYQTSRHFGIRNFGTIFGILEGLITLASGVGPVLAAGIYDVSGDYRLVFWAAIPLCAAASLMVGTLGPYRPELIEPAVAPASADADPLVPPGP